LYNIVDRACHLIEDLQDPNIIHNMSGNQQPIPALYAKLPMLSSSFSTVGRDVYWQRPAPGRPKCNIDASFSQSMNRIGIGICVCDDDGAFVMAKTMSFLPL